MKKMTRHQIVIGLSYFFCAFNCIILSLVSITAVSGADTSLVGLGLIFLIMTPISVVDPRKEMQGQVAAVISIVLHVSFSTLLMFFCFQPWLAAIYIPEAVGLIALEATHPKDNHK